MNWFHVTIHARPSSATVGPMTEIGGLQLATLAVPPGAAAGPLPVSFDEAVAKLGSLPRMFVEPDGSLVWTASGPPAWQVDGMLHDRGDRLSHVEIKGTCPTADVVRYLALVGGGAAPLMFQSVREGVFLDTEGFIALAAGAGFGVR